MLETEDGRRRGEQSNAKIILHEAGIRETGNKRAEVRVDSRSEGKHSSL